MAFAVGKRVVAECESVARRPRLGVVEEVLRGDLGPAERVHQEDYRAAGSRVIALMTKEQRARSVGWFKSEPRWMCDFRLKALDHFLARKQPRGPPMLAQLDGAAVPAYCRFQRVERERHECAAGVPPSGFNLRSLMSV
jgi:hypothetical protein